MTINRDKLITLLVEKTGMDRQDVEVQLDELTSRIMDAANRGKALELKGFGLFYFDEEGELTFRASDQLDSEINFTHAGMEPVELEAPKKGSPSTADIQAIEEDTSKPENEEIEKKADPDDSEGDDVFGIGKTLAGQSEGDESDSEPFERLFQEDSSKIKAKPQPEEKIKKAGTTTGKKSPKPNTSKKSQVRKTRDPMNTIIVVVLAAVFLFVGYFVFTEFLNPPEQNTDTQQPVAEVEDPPATAEQDVTEAGEPEMPATVELPEPEEESEPADDSADEVTESEPYGLYGELQDVDGDLFTIVVHSLRQRGVAERTAEELRQDGFHVNINERIVDERTVFRVGVGQFATIREAQQEAETLPEPFNNQNFIQRIQ